MKPVVSIVGKANSGKTTLICKLISDLKNRGLKVATIKHDVHGFEIDKPGKDTWKHAKAGSSNVVISSPQKIAMIEELEKEKPLDEIVQRIQNVDIILTEGYKSENKPKVEVIRTEINGEPLCDENETIAIACDDENFKYGSVPVFNWNDSVGLVDLIADKFIN